jgi:hypothetical protein
MPRITVTIISSIRVKPLLLVFLIFNFFIYSLLLA